MFKGSTLPVRLQQLLPHHWLSRAARWAAGCRLRWVREPWIRIMIRLYNIRMDEAAEPNPGHYPCFDAFFTRALRAGVRPITAPTDCITSPIDGAITTIGYMEQNRLPQAKGQLFELQELFADCPGDPATCFRDGAFACLYLAPGDYHRIHMPLDATPTVACHVPGRLYSVGRRSRQRIPRLYARNERLLLLFDSAAGPMALIMVGAMLVGGLESVCTGRVHIGGALPLLCKTSLRRGQELGRFHYGSSVLLLFTRGRIQWTGEQPSPVRMGQQLARPRP